MIRLITRLPFVFLFIIPLGLLGGRVSQYERILTLANLSFIIVIGGVLSFKSGEFSRILKSLFGIDVEGSIYWASFLFVLILTVMCSSFLSMSIGDFNLGLVSKVFIYVLGLIALLLFYLKGTKRYSVMGILVFYMLLVVLDGLYFLQSPNWMIVCLLYLSAVVILFNLSEVEVNEKGKAFL